jgi:hypothetical protein
MAYGNNGYNNSAGERKPWNNNNSSRGEFTPKPKSEWKPREVKEVGIYLPYAVYAEDSVNETFLKKLPSLCANLEHKGFILRTGANGKTDLAAREHTKKHEIYKPWKSFAAEVEDFYATALDEAKIEMAKYHPGWAKIPEKAHIIVATQTHLMLGKFLTSPSRFLICYSEDSVEQASKSTIKTGRVGILLRIAAVNNIPVFNFANGTAEDRLMNYIEEFVSLDQLDKKESNENSGRNFASTGENRRPQPLPLEDEGDVDFADDDFIF